MKKLVIVVAMVLFAGCGAFSDNRYHKVASATIPIQEKSEFVNKTIQSDGRFAVFANPYSASLPDKEPNLTCIDISKGKLAWSKGITPSIKPRFVVFADSVFTLVDSKLAKINLETGNQSFLSDEKLEELAGADEKTVYCTKSKLVSDMKFDFSLLSFDLQTGNQNWNTKIDMNYGWVFPGNETITVFTSNTVDKKFAVLDKVTGKVLRYEPISTRDYLPNLDNNSDIVYFHDNALNLSTKEKSEKLVEYKDLPDWAGVSGFYAKGSLFIYRKNHEMQKIDPKTGKQFFSLDFKNNGYYKTDGENEHLLRINDLEFSLVSMDEGKTVSTYQLEKSIMSYTITKDDFALLLNPNKIVLLDRKGLSLKQEIETDKTVRNLLGSNNGVFGIAYDDGQVAVYSRSLTTDTH